MDKIEKELTELRENQVYLLETIKSQLDLINSMQDQIIAQDTILWNIRHFVFDSYGEDIFQGHYEKETDAKKPVFLRVIK